MIRAPTIDDLTEIDIKRRDRINYATRILTYKVWFEYEKALEIFDEFDVAYIQAYKYFENPQESSDIRPISLFLSGEINTGKTTLVVKYMSYCKQIAEIEGRNFSEDDIKYFETPVRVTFKRMFASILEELEKKQKFNDAAIKMRKFFQKYQRLPKLIDEEVIGIYNTIVSGYWVNYGIKKWNDFLLYIFGEVNFNSTKYVSLDGFNKAKYDLHKYYEETGKLPLYDDFEGITNAIKKGYWIKYGINTWNDILEYIFGNVNRNNWDYSDKGLLNQIKGKLLEFKRKNGRRPRITDNGMYTYKNVVRIGIFSDKGIHTWSELLKFTFGKANRERNKYVGKIGLQTAVSELRDFYKSNGRIATTLDKTGILGAINRGEWVKFHIEKWEDLLNLTYKGIDLHPFKYLGEEGLEKAIQELKDFKLKNKELPRIKDFRQIWYMIRRGEWKSHGIITWNKLLLYVFGDVNRITNKYKGRKGLEIIKREFKEFEHKNNRIPFANEMKGIRSAIRRGEWLTLGIRKWNDLIKYIFGENKLTRNKYIGEEGLKIALKELEEFKRKYERKPKYKDKEMSGITSAIHRGEWLTLGIKTWNDILQKVFGEVNSIKYKGKRGLEITIKILKEFNKTQNRIPRTNDKGMSGIYRAVNRGEWTDFGIKDWSELINIIFHDGNSSLS